MNCFEAKNDFIAFWQKNLSRQRQAQLLAHLHRCATCDRSFRVFALTAPVLYSATEPDSTTDTRWQSSPETGEFNLPDTSSSTRDWPPVGSMNRILAAFVMAAAALVALYFTAPPHITFEDAITADNANAEVASYSSTDSLFGQALMIQNTVGPDRADE